MDYVPRHTMERALRRLGRRALADRLHAMRALADVRGVRYLDDRGRARTIDVALKPWILTSDQLFCFHWVAQLLSDALLRLAHLHARVPAVRQVVRFEPERERWMRLAAHPRSRPLAVIGRLDSTAIYDHADWRAAFRMLEPNAVGVGGVHYAPTGCAITLDVLGDVLAAALPGRALTATPDPRQLLMEELEAVAARLRRPLRGLALIENTDFTTGTDEFQELARYFRRLGLSVVVADPRELRLAGGRLYAGRTPVDLLYRDSELAEFIEMERRGAKLTALRQAIREGRLISGLAWEFDQKSAWEIFTDARYTGAFTREQRRLFREHLLWTRLVREERVSDPQGRLVDLPAYIRRHQSRLVLKPNTLFGGEGVLIGSEVSRREWERGLGTALRACPAPSRPTAPAGQAGGDGRQGKERYVVQERAAIPTDTFPSLTERGSVTWQERCVVSGFFFSSTGVGLVGRFSGQSIVNVSRGGGLIPALWVH